MTGQHSRVWDSAVAILTVTLVCAAVGVFGLPVLFAAPPAASVWETPAWLVAAILVALIVLVELPRLAPPLSKALLGQATTLGSAVGPSVTPSQTLLLARLALWGLALVITQAIVRRPVALLLGGQRDAPPVEAGVAAVALVLVLALLIWLYQTGRPVVQSMTLRAIDAAIPTVSPAVLSEPTRTILPITSPPGIGGEATTVVGRVEERTVASPGRGGSDEKTMVSAREAGGDATVVTPSVVDADATVVARQVDADATLVSPRGDADATVVSVRPADPDETVVRPREDPKAPAAADEER